MDATLILGRSRGTVRPYVAPRLLLALPLDRSLSDTSGATGGFLLPGGLAFVVHPRVKLFLEAGFTTIWAYPSQGVSLGGYGVVGFSVRLTR